MTTPARTDLLALLGRLRDAQRDIIFREARSSSPPGDNAIRKIADLENAIAAVEAIIDEVAQEERQTGAA
jgi:hypothetical protein